MRLLEKTSTFARVSALPAAVIALYLAFRWLARPEGAAAVTLDVLLLILTASASYFSFQRLVTPVAENIRDHVKTFSSPRASSDEFMPLKNCELEDVIESVNELQKVIDSANTRIGSAVMKLLPKLLDMALLIDERAVSSRRELDDASTLASAARRTSQTFDMIGHNVKLAEDAAERSKNNITDTRNEFEGCISLTRRSMDGIEEMTWAVRDVARDSEAIQDVVEIIEDLADQTNMLALNASIEASRAGEWGKGFAVVAEEIRKLAEEAGRSVGVIREIVKKNDDRIKGMSTRFDEFAGGLRDTLESFSRVGVLLDETVEVVGKVTEVSQAVNNAMEEQSRTNEGLNQMHAGMLARIDHAAGRMEILRNSLRQTAALIGELGGKTLLLRSEGNFLSRLVDESERFAAEVAAKVEEAVSEGKIDLSDLRPSPSASVQPHQQSHFPPRYRVVDKGSLRGAPVIETSWYKAFGEFMPVINRAAMIKLERDHGRLAIDGAEIKVEYLFALFCDVNGYVPYNVDRYEMPMDPSLPPEENARRNRGRRIFNDPVGLAAGSSTAPARLDIYFREDTGEILPHISTPVQINVNGEQIHIGGFRIGLRVLEI